MAYAIDHCKVPLRACEVPDPIAGPHNAVMAIAARSVNAARCGIDYSFLFMPADAAQPGQIGRLVGFDAVPQTMDRVASGNARGKAVIEAVPATVHPSREA